MGVDRPRIHHDLHHAQHGHGHAHQQPAARAAVLLVGARDFERPGHVADPGQGGQQPRHRLGAIAPADHHAPRGDIGDRGLHARLAAQVLFDQPRAGGAADVLRRQRDLGAAAVKRADKLGAQLRSVVGGPDRLGLAPGVVVDGAGEAGFIPVQVGKACRMEGLRQCLATAAAEHPAAAVQLGGKRLGIRDGQAAMEAGKPRTGAGRTRARGVTERGRRVRCQQAGRRTGDWGRRHGDLFLPNGGYMRVPESTLI
ncbi:hypothetical protein D9M72_358400 [compost metagenome]